MRWLHGTNYELTSCSIIKKELVANCCIQSVDSRIWCIMGKQSTSGWSGHSQLSVGLHHITSCHITPCHSCCWLFSSNRTPCYAWFLTDKCVQNKILLKKTFWRDLEFCWVEKLHNFLITSSHAFTGMYFRKWIEELEGEFRSFSTFQLLPKLPVTCQD